MIAYLAPTSLTHLLNRELKGKKKQYGDLFLSEEPLQKVYFVQNIWQECEIVEITSIADAARKLRALQKYWYHYSFQLHRRVTLIQELLPPIKQLSFPATPLNIGSYTLLSENEMLISKRCLRPFPNGVANFIENKKDPPSRAYLKLWEIFTILQKHPNSKDNCLEIGAAPGGWSWVLKDLGVKLTAVDRASLAPNVQGRVTFIRGDAFKLDPKEFEPLDWIFSDAICYPEKLFEWIGKFLAIHNANFVCTIKFQGNDHYEWIKRFANIENSNLFHLSHNKHELTWVKFKKY